jgi:cell division protein YceG involved in septum cleavage
MSYGTVIVRRVALYGFVAVFLGVSISALIAIESKQVVYKSQQIPNVLTNDVTPFPVSVDPSNATITEQVIVDEFYNQYIASESESNDGWLSKLAAVLQTNQIYQQLASPVSRIIVVWPGERSEEVTKNIGDVLRWDASQRAEFVTLMEDNTFNFSQGFIPPGKFVTHRNASPADIATLLQEEFASSVTDRYTSGVSAYITLDEALVIASLIEREARDFENMREVSGVIWNRIFIDMPLQLDASLQYAKANNPYESNWWPAVRPADKFIDSPFNTYQNKGLPPEPIANPSVDAIVAALNPYTTECVYYFHSRTREYYCSVTYEEHVRKLQEVYGTGS